MATFWPSWLPQQLPSFTSDGTRDFLKAIETWKARCFALERKNDEARYEAGMYKCLYDLWETRATDYQGAVMDLLDALRLAETQLNEVALRNGPIEALAPIRAALSKYDTPAHSRPQGKTP